MREAKEKHQPKAAAAKEAASRELERRDQYLSSLIQRAKIKDDGDEKKMEEPPEPRPSVAAPEKHAEKRQAQHPQHLKKEIKAKEGPAAGDGEAAGGVGNAKAAAEVEQNVRVRAADMPPALQKRAFRCAWEALASMPKLDSKRLALALKKEFDSAYGPAWHCIVGTSFGSYVTHSFGGFLYFSIDKVYILLFRTVVEPLPPLKTILES